MSYTTTVTKLSERADWRVTVQVHPHFSADPERQAVVTMGPVILHGDPEQMAAMLDRARDLLADELAQEKVVPMTSLGRRGVK